MPCTRASEAQRPTILHRKEQGKARIAATKKNQTSTALQPPRTVKALESEKIVAFCTSVPIPQNSSKAALILAFAWEIQSTKARPIGASNNAFKAPRKKTNFAARMITTFREKQASRTLK